MTNSEIKGLWNHFPLFMSKLPNPGILLTTGSPATRENIMTLGWIEAGCLWQEYCVSILVRPERFSYKLLTEHPEFTLNILPDSYKSALNFCGSNSGSYCDKFVETGLTRLRSEKIETSSIREAELIIECKVIHETEVEPEKLTDLYRIRHYTSGDYHRIITGLIMNYRYFPEGSAKPD